MDRSVLRLKTGCGTAGSTCGSSGGRLEEANLAFLLRTFASTRRPRTYNRVPLRKRSKSANGRHLERMSAHGSELRWRVAAIQICQDHAPGRKVACRQRS